jgi:hypothetical protein
MWKQEICWIADLGLGKEKSKLHCLPAARMVLSVIDLHVAEVQSLRNLSICRSSLLQ